MGGDNSPDKVIEGIRLHSNSSNDVIYKIFGEKNLLNPLIEKHNLSKQKIELIHTTDAVQGEDTALSAAKRGKNTSLWLAIDSVKNNKAHAIVSAGNTGALFLISKLNLKMIDNIENQLWLRFGPAKKE